MICQNVCCDRLFVGFCLTDLEAGQRSKQKTLKHQIETEKLKAEEKMHLETSLLVVLRKRNLLPPVYFCYRNLAERQHQFVYVTEKEKEKRWIVREGAEMEKKTERKWENRTLSEQLQDKASHSNTISWRYWKGRNGNELRLKIPMPRGGCSNTKAFSEEANI